MTLKPHIFKAFITGILCYYQITRIFTDIFSSHDLIQTSTGIKARLFVAVILTDIFFRAVAPAVRREVFLYSTAVEYNQHNNTIYYILHAVELLHFHHGSVVIPLYF